MNSVAQQPITIAPTNPMTLLADKSNNVHISNLNEIVFENVNDEYGWGMYGDFKVLIHKETGYINAPKLCAQGGKRFENWLKNERSKELIEVIGRHAYSNSTERNENVQPTFEPSGVPNELRGTYIHPLLVPHVAGWVSPQFAVAVSYIVNNHIVRKYKDAVREKEIALQQKDATIEEKECKITSLEKYIADFRRETKETLNRMGYKLDVANENVICSLQALGVVCPRSVPADRIPERNQEKMYIFRMSPDEDGMEYRAINCQQQSYKQQLKTFGLDERQLAYESPSHPNPVEEWLKFKNQMVSTGKAVFKNRRFKLIGGCVEEAMRHILTGIYNERNNPYQQSMNRLFETYLGEGRNGGEETKEETKEETQNRGETKEEPPVEEGDQDIPPEDPRTVEGLSETDLLMKTRADLMEMARHSGRKGFSKLKKVELVRWLISVE